MGQEEKTLHMDIYGFDHFQDGQLYLFVLPGTFKILQLNWSVNSARMRLSSNKSELKFDSLKSDLF